MSHSYRELHDKVHGLVMGGCCCLLAAIVIGLGVWSGIRHKLFEDDGMAVLRNTCAIFDDALLVWQVVFVQAMVIGSLLTAWVATWWLMRDRLPRGEKHHRGASMEYTNHDA